MNELEFVLRLMDIYGFFDLKKNFKQQQKI